MTSEPSSPEISTFRRPPEDLPGIDMAAAWRFANGNLRHLVRMHELFQATYGGSFISNYLATRANNDWKAATRAAHTFKTGARMIGASQLGSYAEALEFACRAESPTEASQALDRTCTELNLVLSSLSRFRATLSTTLRP